MNEEEITREAASCFFSIQFELPMMAFQGRIAEVAEKNSIRLHYTQNKRRCN
jgi:hypothetical protein